MAHKSPFLWRWRWFLVAFGMLLLAIWILFQPLGTNGLQAHPQPVEDYVAAVQRIQKIYAKDSAALNPLCRILLLTQGRKAERSVVMVHGYTSCPHQFFELGKQFYDLGYNVLIAPMPYHGLTDRMTDAHAKLTAKDLALYADEVVDIAQGLGEHVTVMGLSVGGVVTAWAAQNRTDIDLAVLISPAFGYGVIPPPATAAAMNIFSILPNGFDWWNPEKKEQGGVPHGYPRYAKRALAEALRLGFSVQQSAQKQQLTTPMLVITNANDHQINNERTAAIVELWRKKGAKLETHEFPESLQLNHDLIEPYYQKEQTEQLIYPQLLEWILTAHGDSLPIVYRLIAKTDQADINYAAIEQINGLQGPSQIEPAFQPVKGKSTVYQFKASYPGLSFRGNGYYIFHDVLTLKTDAKNQIVDAYQYTLEWTDTPTIDLFRNTAKNITLENNLNTAALRLIRQDSLEGAPQLLPENGVLQWK